MQNAMPELRLAPGREASLARRHPWIFSGAVASAPAGAAPGDLVRVVSSSGEELAQAFWSPASQIRARVLSFDPAEPDVASEPWIASKIAAAWTRRAGFWNRASHDAARVVHGEGDGLPGLVVDRYAGALCVQLLSAGFDRRRSEIAAALLDLFPDVSVVWERSEGKARAREGLEDRCGLLASRPGTAAVDPSAARALTDAFAALCGLAGFLLVAGTDHTIDSNTVAGRGFTAIMVSWLAKFNPFSMILTSFLIVYLQRGAGQVATDMGLNKSFSDIITGIIIFFIIGCEFFINYQIKRTGSNGEGK